MARKIYSPRPKKREPRGKSRKSPLPGGRAYGTPANRKNVREWADKLESIGYKYNQSVGKERKFKNF
jgi:hypothetical protein